MILTIILILLNINLQAKSENELGLSFNTLSGSGLNYNREITPKINLELSAFYFYLGENPPQEYDTFLNFGIELQYNLYKNSSNRVYLLLGGSIWQINEYYIIQIPVVNGSPREKQINIESNLNNYGFGVGHEIRLLKSFSFSYSLNYQFQNNKENTYNGFPSISNSNKYSGLGFGISFRYRF